MNDSIESLRESAFEAVDRADSVAAVEEQRVQLLGKKGVVTRQLKQLGAMAPDERKAAGVQLNTLKTELSDRLIARRQQLEAARAEEKLRDEAIDVTLPGRGWPPGAAHPITQTRQRIESWFGQNGFEVVHGPEIEDDFHNFEALNVPPDHPARAMQDTFYVDDGRLLLRTHTSPVQIRAMTERRPPIRIIAPGRVFRCDSDRTHSPMFHQVEALYVARRVSFAELRSELTRFLNAFFDRPLNLRFRPSYFPFTEPSAEVDIDGESLGTARGWMEILGCGMVHPNVLKAVNINPDEYTGYAIGMGIERLAMLRYGVDDLRQFYANDLRFLRQF